MRVICLPLSIAPDDLNPPTKFTIKRLWVSWQFDLEPEEHQEASRELEAFSARLDQFDFGHGNPKLAPNETLFRAHMAQTFRHHRMDLFYKIGSLFKPGTTAISVEGSVAMIAENRVKTSWSIEEAVAEATSFKEDGNGCVEKRRYDKGVGRYLDGLAALIPWSSDPTLMTFEQAGHHGLRQIEQALLMNIAVGANKAALAFPKTRKDNPWAKLCQLATATLLQHPFLTWHGLVRVVTLQEQGIRIAPAAWRSEVVAEVKSMSEARGAWKTRDQDGWAHEECGEGHRCYRLM